MAIEWDAAPTATGYRVYYGTESGQYTYSHDAGAARSASLSGLADCTRYFVAVKAYNTAGESAAYSNEISGWARPAITFHAPDHALSGMTPLRIRGENFAPGATLLVGEAAGGPLPLIDDVTVAGCGLITARVTLPDGAAGGSFDVRVRNPDGVTSLPRTVAVTTGIDPAGWSVVSVDSEELDSLPGDREHAIDGDPLTFWHTAVVPQSAPPPHDIVIDLGATYSIEAFGYLPRQSGADSAQGIARHVAIDVSTTGQAWVPAAAGRLTADPLDREMRVIEISARRGRYVRFRALSGVGGALATAVAEIAIGGVADNLPPVATIAAPADDVTLTGAGERTFDGSASDPDGDTPLEYTWTFPACATPQTSSALDPGLVRFTCAPGDYEVRLHVCDARGLCADARRRVAVLPSDCIPVPSTGYVVSATSEESTSFAVGRAFDGNASTIWHTAWSTPSPAQPHVVDIVLPADRELCALGYTPRQDGGNGRIRHFEIETSSSTSVWTLAASGTLVEGSSGTERVVGIAPVRTRRVRLRALSDVNGTPWTSAAEIRLFARSANVAPTVRITGAPGTMVVAHGATLAFGSVASDGQGPIASMSWTFPSCAEPAQVSGGETGSVRFDCPPGQYEARLEACDTAGACSATTRRVAVIDEGCEFLPRDAWSVLNATSEETSTGDWSAARSIDSQPQTFWHTSRGEGETPPPHWIAIDLGEERDICALSYLPRQDGETAGTIHDFNFGVNRGGWWTTIAAGVLVPDASDLSRRAIPLPVRRARAIRLRSMSEVGGGPWASAAEIGIYARPRNQPPVVTLLAPSSSKVTVPAGGVIAFVGLVVDPEGQSTEIAWGLPSCVSTVDSDPAVSRVLQFDCAPGSYSVTLSACDSTGDCGSELRLVSVQGGACDTLDAAGWTFSADSQQAGFEVDRAFDGSAATIWHTRWGSVDPPPPHTVVIDLHGQRTLCGLGYLPRQDGGANGMIRGYQVAVSADGTSWTLVSSGTLVTTPADRSERSVGFVPVAGRFVRLTALTEVNGNPWSSAAEIRLEGY